MSEGPKVTTSVETMAYYNMILTEAIFQLLEEKGCSHAPRSRSGSLPAQTYAFDFGFFTFFLAGFFGIVGPPWRGFYTAT